MSGARLISVRPEQAEELVTRAASFARRGEDGQQSESAALVSVITEDGCALRSRQLERAKRPKSESRCQGRSVRRRCHAPNLDRAAVIIKKSKV